jgi:hypothetical protein
MSKIAVKIDVKKISKDDLYAGKKGTYLDAILIPNKDGASDYGDDGFVVQGVTKEKRDAGERGPIIGNWRYIGQGASGNATNRNNEPEADDPF